LLYQVATGGLSPGDIASPLRSVLKKNKNTFVLMGEAVDIDYPRQKVILTDGEIDFDTLVVATGSSHDYYGNEQWREIAPGLKTIEDALEIRTRIFTAFERAERETDDSARKALLTFVIVGAGPTGVELAGSLSEIAFDTLKRDFRHIDPRQAQIILVEGAPRILTTFPEDLSRAALKSLEKIHIKVELGARIVNITSEGVTVRRGETTFPIAAKTILWSAGVKASPLGKAIVEGNDELIDSAGRIKVEPDLSIHGRPNVFVIGDLALYVHQTGSPLPGIAPVAMSQARYVARLIKNRIEGKPVGRYHYRNKGVLATIGRASAVADFGRIRISGLMAWLLWTFVHLMYLVEFENRLLVFVQWTWNYFTRNRGARLITGEGTPRSSIRHDGPPRI